MGWKSYEFLCTKCQRIFADLVCNDAAPDPCPHCGSKSGFVRQFPTPALLSKIIPDYPGSKRLKAGYQHTHNRPAEKSASQVSMVGGKKR